MEPTREGALVDLLDLILVKGVVLHADVIITVADIPLIGISLKAAVAGMKTMLDYGMMEVWDAKIRNRILEEEQREKATLDVISK
jgi:exosome complex RNA-binding protein Rrp42 (RNase PH superfamily)